MVRLVFAQHDIVAYIQHDIREYDNCSPPLLDLLVSPANVSWVHRASTEIGGGYKRDTLEQGSLLGGIGGLRKQPRESFHGATVERGPIDKNIMFNPDSAMAADLSFEPELLELPVHTLAA